MRENKIIIFDTTLRDGEQSPGATMSINDKIAIAQSLDQMGVDVIEAGFAIASEGDFQCIEKISKIIKNACVCSLARAKKQDIEAAANALKHANKPRIHTFISTSTIHLQHQLKMTPDEVLNAITDSVKYARNLCDDVEWSAMDATRSDIDFLSRAVECAIDAGAKTINIPDTVGYVLPHEYAALIRTLKEKIPASDKVIFSVHCHNDLGLAVANSIAALEAGAKQVECTINGIGERAGNAALEEIIMAINTRKDKLNFHSSIDTKQISTISKLVAQASGFVVQKNKAIVGANAFAHESGIHQDGMLKSKETYEIMQPESIGLEKSELVMGKHSGRAAFRDKLTRYKINVSEVEFENLFKRFKHLGDCKKNITDEDIISIATGKKNPEKIIWFDGQFIPWNDANIHLLSHGLHYASTVFEGERAYNGKVFKLQEHNIRFHHSAEMLGFKIPYSVAELNTITHELLQKNNLVNAYVRPIAWCGTETLSVSSSKCTVHVAMAAWEWGSYFKTEKLFTEGLKLMWANWVRPAPNMAPVHAKAAGLYMIATMSKNQAEAAGYHDALMLDYRGYVAECTGANIFMVKNNTIHTPIVDCILNGITRQTIIELAKQNEITIIERHIKPEEINNADEIFLTGSAAEVAPVGQIGKQCFKVGPITKLLANEYARIVGKFYEKTRTTDCQAETVN